jgi:signal transduction histidine kinase/ActR/RegA family two-component response regulator
VTSTADDIVIKRRQGGKRGGKSEPPPRAPFDRKQLEAQLRQAQKMESIARHAGGVAHDFNNQLGVIEGYAALLGKHLPPDERLKRYAGEIYKAAERGAALTRQLLAFSRRQVLEPRRTDVNALVADQAGALLRLLGDDVAVRTNLDPGIEDVVVDRARIEDVLAILATNARDAMPSGGELTIETRNVQLDRGLVDQLEVIHAGSYVSISIRDTGVGMDESVKAQLFEPFFSTKAPGKGRGLGLATVYGIVKQSGGYVWVDSEPGRGTTVVVFLPSAGHAASEGPVEAAVSSRTRRAETILVVEDETALRSVMKECLEALGYRVLEAAGGGEALKLADSSTERIDAMVTDLLMPGVGGRELAERLAATRPEIRVLFMSGYTDDAVVQQGVQSAETSFLQKPFTAEALAQKLRGLLDRSPGAPPL